jgi:putative hydrolase of the HAD superfamily
MHLVIFDNDGVLYDDSITGRVFMDILHNWYAHFIQASDIELAKSEILHLKTKHQTQFSLVALMKEHNLDFQEIYHHTYGQVDLSTCQIEFDQHRSQVLSQILSHKIVFTNNPRQFAIRVLKQNGLINHFGTIIGLEDMDFVQKPHLKPYLSIMSKFPQYTRFTFIDDSIKNLDTAKMLGWNTIWFNPQSINPQVNCSHTIISSFDELGRMNL